MSGKTRKQLRSVLSYTGRLIDVIDLAPVDIELAHIAHSLATKPRFNGSACMPYSIAQHCVLAAKYAPVGLSKQVALLHDAAEAYLYDISRPVKGEPAFADLVCLEHDIQDRIFTKYIPDWAEIKETKAADYHWIDKQLLTNECRALLRNWESISAGSDFAEVIIPIDVWPWQEAEQTFLTLAAVLGISD